MTIGIETAETPALSPDADELARRPKLTTPMDLVAKLENLYRCGLATGSSTGWPCLDRLWQVHSGLLVIVTGWPGSGKSEWLDALALNLIAKAGWTFAYFSPENLPSELHLQKLLEKVLRIPFFDGPTKRMESHELAAGVGLLEGKVTWLPTGKPNGDGLTIEDILDDADAWLQSNAEWDKPGLVIDPWNEIAHRRAANVLETEYVSIVLGRIRRWARDRNVTVFVVAHPAKLPRDANGKLPIPRPDSISTSIHFWNKADIALTVWRDIHADPPSRSVDVHVQKVRFKHHGRPGIATFEWDRVTGTYSDPETKVVPIQGRKAKAKPLDEKGEIEL